jgi:hypothetical protein
MKTNPPARRAVAVALLALTPFAAAACGDKKTDTPSDSMTTTTVAMKKDSMTTTTEAMKKDDMMTSTTVAMKDDMMTSTTEAMKDDSMTSTSMMSDK